MPSQMDVPALNPKKDPIRLLLENGEQFTSGIRHRAAYLFHITVFVRLRSCETYLCRLRGYDFEAIWSSEEARYDFFEDLECFVIRLRSCIDSLLGEVNLVFQLDIPRRDVDFDTVLERLLAANEGLMDEIDAFSRSQTFDYLDKFRNLTLHQSLAVIESRSTFDRKTGKTRPRGPYLPDNPAKDPIKFTYYSRIRIVPKCEELLSKVKGLTESVNESILTELQRVRVMN